MLSVSNARPEDHALVTLQQVWADRDFTDVTLVTADNRQLEAHKVILSSCSSLFRNILLRNPHPNPVLYLHNITEQGLAEVLEFAYLGRVQLPEEKLEDFLNMGRILGLTGLAKELFHVQPTQYNQNERKFEQEDIAKNNENAIKKEPTVNFAAVSPVAEKKHKREDTESMLCDICPFIASSKSKLKSHRYKCKRKQENMYLGEIFDDELPCEWCEFHVENVLQMKEHRITFHGGRYKCKECKTKSFLQKELLYSHIAKHHQDKGVHVNKLE
jgi:hypothetical protein